jgi:diguanylate cyclase (GGDEF)-like protein
VTVRPVTGLPPGCLAGRSLGWCALAAGLSWAGATAFAASDLQWHSPDVRLLGVLLSCAGLSARRDRHAASGRLRGWFPPAWCLPVAALLPPGWAVIAPVPLAALACRRADRDLAYCQVIASAAAGLGFGAASLALHASGVAARTPPAAVRPEWLAALAACGVLQQAASSALIVIAVHGNWLKSRLLTLPRDLDLPGAVADLCIGMLVASAVTASHWYAVLAVPLVTPLERSRQHRELARTARTDAKTGLLNAAAWQQAASAETSRAARTGRPLAMAMLDIDYFKKVNDAYGHLAGDRVLAAIAGILTAQLRGYDVAGRFGGEEFAVLLPDTTEAGACRIAERLRAQIAATPMAGDGKGSHPGRRVTVSIGVAAARPGCDTTEELIGAADAALYAAKQAGRNRVRCAAFLPALALAAEGRATWLAGQPGVIIPGVPGKRRAFP